jgi:hypothetical protein
MPFDDYHVDGEGFPRNVTRVSVSRRVSLPNPSEPFRILRSTQRHQPGNEKFTTKSSHASECKPEKTYKLQLGSKSLA